MKCLPGSRRRCGIGLSRVLLHQVVHNGDNQSLLMGACSRWGEHSLLTRWCGAASVLRPTLGTCFLVGMKAGTDRGNMTEKLVLAWAKPLFFLFNV